MIKRTHILGLLLLTAFVTAGIVLLRSGVYGWTLFILVPLFLGCASCWIFSPPDPWSAAAQGAVSAIVASGLPLLLGLDGLACMIMALPVTVPFGALGGVLAYYAKQPVVNVKNFTALLLLPAATLAWDTKARPPVFQVRTQIVVHATPEEVWQHVITFPDLPEPREWYFHTGLAYPQRAHIDGSGPGAVRYCEFSTGAFVEPIDVWDEPHLLRFRVTANPAPVAEWSPYGAIQPKHLHGYLVSRHGQFRLAPLPNGNTLLEGTTWYQHGLWPAQYWRWWSDAIIHRIHLRVLNEVRILAERGARRAW
ncbi:MAG TPA: SRPBCC family protein [Bryobacteraceae bacterium]|nr:SRPBCC family protein [Bryobacteraceae bacterium]